MQQDLFFLCSNSAHKKICSISCLALKSGFGGQSEKQHDNESGAIFIGTNDGFILRYNYTVPVAIFSAFFTKQSSADAENQGLLGPRATLHVERNVGLARLPVILIRTCLGSQNVFLNSQNGCLNPCFEGSVVGALCGSGVYLYREEDLHPLVGHSKPVVSNASFFCFNSRRGIDGGICIEKGTKLCFYTLAQLVVEEPSSPNPYHQMKISEPLKDMLWIDDSVVLAFRTSCVCARLPAADPSASVALLKVDVLAHDAPSLHLLPHSEFLLVFGREARAFDLHGQARMRCPATALHELGNRALLQAPGHDR